MSPIEAIWATRAISWSCLMRVMSSLARFRSLACFFASQRAACGFTDLALSSACLRTSSTSSDATKVMTWSWFRSRFAHSSNKRRVSRWLRFKTGLKGFFLSGAPNMPSMSCRCCVTRRSASAWLRSRGDIPLSTSGGSKGTTLAACRAALFTARTLAFSSLRACLLRAFSAARLNASSVVALAAASAASRAALASTGVTPKPSPSASGNERGSSREAPRGSPVSASTHAPTTSGSGRGSSSSLS
mmetsp:Transcript_74970/g.146720  ORF Transcript_74970/g.146720 Transcript_74970/m.146720 type:complete len:245 (+) Transcript_74970:286-1020(+)